MSDILAALAQYRASMLRLVVAFLMVIFWAAPPARAALVLDSVVIDPQNVVRPDLLTRALQTWKATPDASRERIAIVDFSRSSSEARLFIVDLRSGAVQSFLTAHGKGSDPSHNGRAVSFSNEAGSNASSIGAYLGMTRYFGQHGLSLRLKGLDATNSNAESRAIVVHSAPYMDPPWRRSHGRPGRSFGCFTVETSRIEHVVASLEGGVLILASP